MTLIWCDWIDAVWWRTLPDAVAAAAGGDLHTGAAIAMCKRHDDRSCTDA